MNTIAQVRAEFYNAIVPAVTSNLLWVARPTIDDTYPLVVYRFFEMNGEYSFDPTGVNRVADNIIFQTDVYCDPSDITNMDTIIEGLKVQLNAIGYRNINSPIEFLETDINKVVRPLRWEKYNV